MAHNVNGASLGPIYERLNDVSNYHPLDAETFADWSMEAGDIVTVSRDGKEYASPVHTSTMTWRGRTPVIAINATGKQRRDPPAKVSRQKYARSGAGMRNVQGIYYEMTSEDGILHSSILMTSSILRTEFNNSISDVHSFIEETADHIRSDVYASSSQIYSSIQQTASNLRIELGNAVSDLHTVIEATAEGVRSDVYASSSQIYSAIQQTASNFRIELGNAVSDLHTVIETTAEGVRSDVYASSSQIYSAIQQTASNFRIELGNAVSDLHTVIETTAEGVRSDVYASSSQIYSAIQQTASNFRIELGNAVSDLHTVIETTAEGVRSDVYASSSQIYSAIQQTASNFRIELGNAVSDLHAVIETTAEGVRSDVYASSSQIYSSIRQTASSIRSEIGNTISNVYTAIEQTANTIIFEVKKGARVFHQYSDPFLTEEVKDGDIWVKDSGASTHGRAGSFKYGQLESFRYADFFGQEIYVRKGGEWVGPIGGSQLENISRARIEEAEDHIAIITDNMGGDYAEFIVEMGRIHSRVEDVEAGLQSTIEQTASMIRSAVFTANSTMYSEILQTHSMIKSEVYNAESKVYTEIRQTANNISLVVSHKRAQYIQNEDPSPTHTMYDGDLWIRYKGNIYSHAAMNTLTHAALGSVKYIDYLGKETKVWKGDVWLPYYDERAQHIDETRVDINENGIYLLKGDLSEQYSQFQVERNQIRSIVNDKINGVGTQITQTAREIRSEAYASSSKIYTSIVQTASNIRTELHNAVSDLHVEIEATAGSVRSAVYASSSQLYSVIMQTASGIESMVGNQISGVQSLISQQADRISLVVSGTGSNAKIRPAQIVAAINDGASSVMIDANRIRLGESDNSSVFSGLATGIQCNKAFTANKGLYIINTAQTYGVDARRLMHTASVSNNTLYIYDVDGNEVVNFSKATTLTPSWSGSAFPLTMAAKQTNSGTPTTVASKTIGFGGLVTAHDIELQLANGGTPTKVANVSNIISCPVKVQQLTTGNPADRYSKDVQFSVSSLLQEKPATSNGDVTPDSDYIGLKKVTVSIDPTLSGSWSSGAYVITPSVGTHSFDIGFGGNYGDHNLEITAWANGDASRKNATQINVPISVGYPTGPTTNPVSRLNKTLAFNVASLLQGKTATNLDDVTPDSDYIGLKKVTININPSVTGNFSGSVLTVRPKVGTSYLGTNKFTLGFGGNVGAHSIELMVSSNGSPTRYGTNGFSIPIRVARNNGPNVAPTQVYDTTLTYSSGLQTKTVTPTENMDVTPGSTFLGLSKVSIDVSAAYNSGYDANHSMFIGDYDITAIPSSYPLSPGQSIEVWPYFKKKDGEYQWGPKYTFSAADTPTPYINNNGTYIWTSSSIPSGATELTRLVSQFNAAKADSDNLIIKVQAGTKTKLYYCTP